MFYSLEMYLYAGTIYMYLYNIGRMELLMRISVNLFKLLKMPEYTDFYVDSTIFKV